MDKAGCFRDHGWDQRDDEGGEEADDGQEKCKEDYHGRNFYFGGCTEERAHSGHKNKGNKEGDDDAADLV